MYYPVHWHFIENLLWWLEGTGGVYELDQQHHLARNEKSSQLYYLTVQDLRRQHQWIVRLYRREWQKRSQAQENRRWHDGFKQYLEDIGKPPAISCGGHSWSRSDKSRKVLEEWNLDLRKTDCKGGDGNLRVKRETVRHSAECKLFQHWGWHADLRWQEEDPASATQLTEQCTEVHSKRRQSQDHRSVSPTQLWRLDKDPRRSRSRGPCWQHRPWDQIESSLFSAWHWSRHFDLRPTKPVQNVWHCQKHEENECLRYRSRPVHL